MLELENCIGAIKERQCFHHTIPDIILEWFFANLALAMLYFKTKNLCNFTKNHFLSKNPIRKANLMNCTY